MDDVYRVTLVILCMSLLSQIPTDLIKRYCLCICTPTHASVILLCTTAVQKLFKHGSHVLFQISLWDCSSSTELLEILAKALNVHIISHVCNFTVLSCFRKLLVIVFYKENIHSINQWSWECAALFKLVFHGICCQLFIIHYTCSYFLNMKLY